MKPLTKIFYGGLLTLLGVLMPALCLAQEAAEGHGGGDAKNQIIALATALAIGAAAFGGALAQGRSSASAFEGMARNPGVQPKIFTSMILALAFIESLVIYALLIAFMLLGKI
ncbi:MAG: ATP synthase F0 subunit C [Pseudomonadota bacterium]